MQVRGIKDIGAFTDGIFARHTMSWQLCKKRKLVVKHMDIGQQLFMPWSYVIGRNLHYSLFFERIDDRVHYKIFAENECAELSKVTCTHHMKTSEKWNYTEGLLSLNKRQTINHFLRVSAFDKLTDFSVNYHVEVAGLYDVAGKILDPSHWNQYLNPDEMHVGLNGHSVISGIEKLMNPAGGLSGQLLARLEQIKERFVLFLSNFNKNEPNHRQKCYQEMDAIMKELQSMRSDSPKLWPVFSELLRDVYYMQQIATWIVNNA